MIMVAMLLILFIAGILAWFAGKMNNAIPRWISLIAAVANLVISISV